MTDKEIIEGNKLLAEFHGKYNTKWHTIGCYPIKDLKYHTSWDWLMPVVEKIEFYTPDEIGSGFAVYINEKQCIIKSKFVDYSYMDNPITGASADTKIESVWLAVVSFIQWYNTQNNKVK